MTNRLRNTRNGRIAYNAWRDRIPGPNSLPVWDGLPDDAKAGWLAIANEILVKCADNSKLYPQPTNMIPEPADAYIDD